MAVTLTPNFDVLFQTIPSPYMVLDSKLIYVAANDAYLKVTDRCREDLLGRHIFENFPNDDEGGQLLSASLQRVLETAREDSIALIPYAIPRTPARGGGFEMRYWTLVHTPLLDADGAVAFIAQNTVDVTELQHLRDLAYGSGVAPVLPAEAVLLQRAKEVQRANATLLRESSQLRDLFMQAPGFMAVVTAPDLTFALANNAFHKLIGGRALIGRPLAEAIPEVAGQGFVDLLENVLRTREVFLAEDLSVQLQRTPGAPLEERVINFVYQPMLDSQGQAWGVFVEGNDVTDRVRAERQQKLLVDELNHRVKNTLATVQSIAAQTLRTTTGPEAFRVAFEARLMALSATQDLLTPSAWRSVALRDVIQRELLPHGADRYSLEGPNIALAPEEVLALGMMFHELTTNAAKYGALSAAHGRVSVDWSLSEIAGRPWLSLAWREVGGPKVSPPARRGFGSRLIERSLQTEIGGQAGLEFPEGGLVCRIALPLKGGRDLG